MSRLQFHECLGRGGYGEVYRCTWHRREMELEVAVKVLNASVAKGSEAQKRLKDEARLLGALTHPGILRVYDLVELGGNVAMIAEYVDGADLDRCVLEGLSAKALLEAVSRVSSALAAAWGDISPVSGKPLRLVHRDVKPENIRITAHGEVKLLDFGVARAAELRRESETASNTVLGSYRYMAPERFDTGLEPHPSVDVFALGCILYEGLAFRRLFEHLSMREMLVLSLPGSERYETFIAERMAELPDLTDATTIQLIRRLVSRDPAHRPMPGRLAALCDDEADRLEGLGLTQWCRSRKWNRLANTPGEWTGRDFEVHDSQSAEHDIGMIYQEPSSEGPDTSDSTVSALGFDPRELVEEPGFAPRDLGFGDDVMPPDAETQPGGGPPPVFEDEPTVGTVRPPPPPVPPIASSTRDPAPPRSNAPRRPDSDPVELPLPRRQPPEREGLATNFDPDETLLKPRSQVLAEEEPVVPSGAPEPTPPSGPGPSEPLPEPSEPAPPEPELVPEPSEPEQTPEASLPEPELEPSEPKPTAPRTPEPKGRPAESYDGPTLPAPPPDAPTLLRGVPDPDRTATETVDLDKLRAKISAEKKRFEKRRAERKLEEDTSTADVPPVESLRQDHIPDDLFDVPITSEVEKGPPDDPDDATPIQVPREQAPTPAAPKPGPARRKVRSSGITGAVIGNLAALGVLLALGFVGLVGWILFF